MSRLCFECAVGTLLHFFLIFLTVAKGFLASNIDRRPSVGRFSYILIAFSCGIALPISTTLAAFVLFPIALQHFSLLLVVSKMVASTHQMFIKVFCFSSLLE